jgi:hypothetical protein
MSIRVVTIVVVVIALASAGVALVPGARGEEIAMQYVDEQPALGLTTSQGFAMHMFETPSKSQGFGRLPPATGAKRYYDELGIGGREYRVVTEATTPPRIWLDANDNGDMTDDPGPFPGESPQVVPNHYTLRLPFAGAAEPVPYRLWLFASRTGGTRYYAKCHMLGRLELGKTWSLVLFDASADGTYANDPLVVDLDGDGRVADSERFRPDQSFRLGDTQVTLLSIAPGGTSIRIRRLPATR